MTISSVTPTLQGAPGTLIRRDLSEARPDQLPVERGQFVDPRQAIDARPQTVERSQPSERGAEHHEELEEEGDQADSGDPSFSEDPSLAGQNRRRRPPPDAPLAVRRAIVEYGRALEAHASRPGHRLNLSA